MAKAGTWCGTIGKIGVGDFISYARLTASIEATNQVAIQCI